MKVASDKYESDIASVQLAIRLHEFSCFHCAFTHLQKKNLTNTATIITIKLTIE
jgi:hypothetical protein